MFGDVFLMFDTFVAEGLFCIVRTRAPQGYPVDDVGDQMEAIEIVHHRHVERRRGRSFFLVAAHVQVLVIGPPVGEPVDQPRIAVESEDDRLVRREESIEVLVW